LSLWTWLDVLASASSLVLAVFALWPGRPSPLRLPLALLAVDQFAWNVSSVSLALSGDFRYRWVSSITSPLFVPLGLHFVLRFVGALRERWARVLLAGAYGVFCAKSLHGLADFLTRDGDLVAGIDRHRVLMLWLGPPMGLLGIALVARHLRRSTTPDERWRAKVLIVALVTVTLLLPTSWLAGLGAPVPPLSSIGTLVFNFALAHLVLGVGIVTGDRRRTVLVAALASLAIVGAYVALFQAFSQRQGLLLITMAGLTLGVGAFVRLTLAEVARTREALQRQATLGQWSDQMAHDLRNPLSAALGAAEVLAEELRRKALPEDRELAAKVVAQLERLDGVIGRYRRLSKLEPALADTDVNALVRRVLALQRFASAGVVDVRFELTEPLPHVGADGELLASALENLVKNGLEAMPRGGNLTVTTALTGGHVTIGVRDTGVGMDPRVREQAFTPLFTTKAQGSGMGLSFVQRVARAHGGDVRLASTEGAGTLVEVLLPLTAKAGHG